MHLYKKIISALLPVLMLAFALPSHASYDGDVSAKSAVLLEATSGEIVYGKSPRERLPMASTTKIMTALVALENSDPDESFAIPKEATGIEGSSVYLIEGESLTMRELIMCLMLESANDAATAIAILTAGGVEEFAGMMNDKAAELGLSDTHFENPHGLDSTEHYTTAADLAKLTAHALKNEAFAEIVATRSTSVTLHDGEGKRLLINHNKMLRMYDGAIGVKTGFTKTSGRCLVSAATRNGVTLIAVTLSAPDDWNDHRKLLDYGFSQYTNVTLAEPGKFSCVLPVAGADGTEAVSCTNNDSFSVTVKNEEVSSLTSVIETTGTLFPTISEGDTVGRVSFYKNGEKIGEIPLSAISAAKAPEIKEGILDKIKKIFGK